MKAFFIIAIAVSLTLGPLGCDGSSPQREGVSSGPSTDASAPASQPTTEASPWVLLSETSADPQMFVDKVDNPYWPLIPGTKWSYEAKTDEGLETIDIVVLSDTKQIMGIPCAIVRDTVKLDGELVEDTFDWYAQDTYGNVWYMGEDSKEYEGGKAVSTAGSWEAGVDGAKPGIKMWATPHLGGPPYYQEYYKGEAEDLGMDLNFDGTAQTPFGTYSNLLVIEEWNPFEPAVVERKYYQSGIGTVREETVKGGSEVVVLTKFEQP